MTPIFFNKIFLRPDVLHYSQNILRESSLLNTDDKYSITYEMAKIVFLSLYDVNAEGLRTLSSVLKKEGHKPYIIFVKRYSKRRLKRGEGEGRDWVGIDMRGRLFVHARGKAISDQEKKLLLRLVHRIDPDLIGMSVTAPLKILYAELTHLIKKNLDIPVIWGGAEPTVNPEDCVKDGDFVCVGEGERTIVELANLLDTGEEFDQVKNLAYARDERFVKNPLFPLVSNLDEIPFKDISPEDKFLIEDGRLTESFSEISYSRSAKYHINSSRGCPFVCSYCCESHYKKLYAPQRFLRRRSPSHVIAELKAAMKRIDYRMVQFEDEIFTLDSAWLEEFSVMYREEIRLPLICYLFPDKDIDRNLEILKKAGLTLACLGLQSGSSRINREIFRRPYQRKRMVRTAAKLKSLKIDYYVDVITHNPFEYEKDLQATLEVLIELPKPFWLCVNKLHIIKGTSIADMMEKAVGDNEKPRDRARLFDFYSRLYWLTPFTRFHRHTLSLIRRFKIFRKFPYLVNPLLLNLPFYFLFFIKKGLRRFRQLV